MNPSNAEIRQFILDVFNDEDFDAFCADHFPDALAEFSPATSLSVKALRLIEYCQSHGIADKLLTALQKVRPEIYRSHNRGHSKDNRASQTWAAIAGVVA